MNLKSKLKCCFEQFIIVIILLIISLIVVVFASSFSYHLFSALPNQTYQFLDHLFQFVFILFCTIFSVIIWTHIFKTRYLDYYNQLKNQMNEEESRKNEWIKPSNTIIENSKKSIREEENLIKQKKENKIIIRDPRHSEYRFINSLFKVMIGIIKFFMLFFCLFLSFALVFFVILLILSFLISKTGLVFLGALLMISSSIIVDIIFLLGLLTLCLIEKMIRKK